MDLRDHCLTMHRYHRWAYGRLFDAVGALSESEYRRDVGLFFGSVHRTLNHLLLVDRVWLDRLIGSPPRYSRLDEELESNREALEAAVHTQCEEWLGYVERIPAGQLGALHRYRSMAGKEFAQPLACLVLHVANHGTHHRGQVSAALTQFGVDAPVMDLPYFLLEG